MNHDEPHFAAILVRLRAEYLEMPGLRLSVEQAARLLGISETRAEIALETLVTDRFLARKVSGLYIRA